MAATEPAPPPPPPSARHPQDRAAATSPSRRRKNSPWKAPPPAAVPHDGLRDPHALEQEHVRAVYDRIARQWHATRYKAWPNVARFVAELPQQPALVADCGCGNGKLAPALRRARHYAVGCDFSLELVRISAHEMRLESQHADALALQPPPEGPEAIAEANATEERARAKVEELLRPFEAEGSASGGGAGSRSDVVR